MGKSPHSILGTHLVTHMTRSPGPDPKPPDHPGGTSMLSVVEVLCLGDWSILTLSITNLSFPNSKESCSCTKENPSKETRRPQEGRQESYQEGRRQEIRQEGCPKEGCQEGCPSQGLIIPSWIVADAGRYDQRPLKIKNKSSFLSFIPASKR